jgi:hypothetical protein
MKYYNMLRAWSELKGCEFPLVDSREKIASAPRPVVADVSPASPSRRPAPKKAKSSTRRRGTTVFVVHGRDSAARDAMFTFLRAVGLKPLEWTQALKLVRKGSPYVGEVLEAAFRGAAAVVVLLTPDDEARLQRRFLKTNDPAHEKELTGQGSSQRCVRRWHGLREGLQQHCACADW